MDEDEKNYQMQLDWHKRLESYQYFEKYLEAHVKYLTSRNENMVAAFKDMFKDPNEYTAQRNFVFMGHSAYIMPERKIIDISKDLVPLIEDTKPNYTNLKLKYPIMFINQKFYIEGFIINGFLLLDIKEANKLNPHIEFEDKYETDIVVLAVILNTKQKYEFYTIRPLMDGKDLGKHYAWSKRDDKDMRKISKIVNSFAANLIQIMTNEAQNIRHIEIPESEERNKKRRKRGKLDIRSVTVLRVGGTLKKYAQTYSSMRESMGVRYFVGGFWRHYNSDFYINKKGTMEWVFPHWRNEDASLTKVSQKVLLKKGPDFRREG